MSDEAEKQAEIKKELLEDAGGYFRGIAATARASLPALKQGVRVIGSNRALAFASEGAVAGQSMMPKALYFGAWGLSGVAVMSDIATRTMDAKPEKTWHTAGYYTAFHIPASLVLPAVIIHKVVHVTEHQVSTQSIFKSLPTRLKSFIPIAAALLSIIPVVPVVDHTCEAVMEPTLGSFLGLEFSHHGHDSHEPHERHEGSPSHEKKE